MLAVMRSAPVSAATTVLYAISLIFQRFIDQLLDRRLDFLTLRWRLLKQHEEHVLLAVHCEIAAASAVPFQFAEIARRRRFGMTGIGANADAKSIAKAVARKIEIVALDTGVRPDLIRCHLLE